MKLDRYYYITSLPALGELGSEPPIGFAELQEYLADDPDRRKLVDSLFLLEDLLQREAFLAEELKEVAPAVLSDRQVRDESPLPAYLVPRAQQESHHRVMLTGSGSDQPSPDGAEIERPSADALWEAYFRHVAELARSLRCEFLAAWVGHEVAMRNALVSVRAKRLGLDETGYLVAGDLAEDSEHTPATIRDWQNASTPLAAHQTLIRSRWNWLADHDRYYSFRNDELAAYASRLMLLHQWRRTMPENRENKQPEGL